MERARSIVGLVAGTVMIASSGAHALLGWKAMSHALRAAQAPDDLIQALGFGWRFGGVAMLAFGCIVAASSWSALKGNPVSPVPAVVIGVTYVAFGAGALFASGFDPFFLIFVIPGLLVLIAALPRRSS